MFRDFSSTRNGGSAVLVARVAVLVDFLAVIVASVSYHFDSGHLAAGIVNFTVSRARAFSPQPHFRQNPISSAGFVSFSRCSQPMHAAFRASNTAASTGPWIASDASAFA
jgi:hypothetical protein